MNKPALILTAAAGFAAGLSAAQPALAQDDVDQRFGTVHFATSCNDIAQRRFDRGMRYQHSFWYTQAKEIFEDAAKADPTCGMAYWGVALTLLNNPHNAPPASNLPQGLAAIQKAKEVGAKTQRERDYIDALSVMYVDHDKIQHRARVASYLKAMEALAAKYADDDEAQSGYAITLNVAASPADKTYANQLKGTAILEPILKRQPRHPGVVHYLIHLSDYPPIAEKGLNAARLYASIAPAAPHAQHMPSHIFTRVGYWKESIASNIASVKAAKADKAASDQLHGQDYMVYAYLQLGQDARAKAVIDEMIAVNGFSETFIAGPYALAASPARYVVERGDWKAAAALEVRPNPLPHIAAVTWFARALGAARSGDTALAEMAIAQLVTLRDALRDKKDAYWAEQVDIQAQVASAWLLLATGRKDEAVAKMSAAADAEDKTDKSPVTPGPLAPARELYGAMLLEQGKAADALAAFEATLRKEPNRLNAILGAAAAASAAGDSAKARQYFAAAAKQASDASVDRADILKARAFVATAK